MNASKTMTVAAVAALAIGGVAFGATWTNTTGGRTPAEALDWHDSANWGGETPPSAAGDVADFSSLTDDTYIRIPSAITIAEVKNTGSGRPILIGDAGITLLRSKGTDDSCALAKVAFYADLSFNHGGSSYLDANNVEFCGDLAVVPYLRNANASFSFRADKYARDANPVRVNPFDLEGWGRCVLGNANAMFVAPRGSEAVKGMWTRTKDSPYLTFAGEAPHALAAGTLVAGEGFGEGTFLKRIFPDGTIELSMAADSSGTGELEFAAFTPQMTIFADTFSYYGGYPELNFAKWRKEDVFRFEANTLSPTYNLYVGQSLPAGTIPATLVLHDTRVPASASYNFQVDQAHFEFAPRIAMSDAPGIHGKLVFRSSTSQLRVTVTNNISAVLGGFKTHSGILVKDGVGTLTFGVAPSKTATGSIVVEEGVLALSAEVPEETSYVKTLAISNGAVVRLPEGGFTCDSLVVESGAIVEGPGYLVLEDASAAEGVTFRGGARVVTPAQVALKAGEYGYYTVAVPAELPGVPAAWFDASAGETMVTNVDADGVIRVERWNDVRGAAYRYCTPKGELKPKLVTNGLGQAQHIYIPVGEGNGDTQSYALFFDRELPGVKSVFRVLNCREGGGQFLAKNENGYRYQGAGDNMFSVKLFVEEYGAVPDYPFYLNGVRANWRNGYAYPGGNKSTAEADLVPLLAEMHFGAGSVTIDNFGFARYPAVRNGRERIYESIYYTNTLTQAEIEQVRAYLMKKWLNAEVAHERLPDGTAALEDVAAGDATVYARPGGAVVVQNVSGAGELVTAGAGEVCVDDLSDATRDVHVTAGTLKVRSFAADGVPGDPYFHGDADDADSFTFNDQSQITAWADVRGGDNTVATWNRYKPLLRVDASLAGHKAIDFGAMQTSNYYLDYRCMMLPEFDGIRTVFSVLDTTNGGGPLLAATAPSKQGYVRNGRLWGLARARNGASDPIVLPGYWYAQLAPASTTENKFSVGLDRAGATRTRLNGTDVSGTITGYTGGWDMVSLATHDPVVVSSIGEEYYASYWRGGGFQLGEYILYRENLSAETVKRVEAYLNKKWFGRETPGYRPATMGAVTVDAGATLTVVGEAPLTVKSLAGAGTVSGKVEMSGAGDLTIAINEDGTVGATQTSGGLTLPATGVIRVTGLVRNLAKGETVAIANVTGDVAGWTVTLVDDPEKAELLSVFVRDGKLYLNRTAPGLMLLVK